MQWSALLRFILIAMAPMPPDVLALLRATSFSTGVVAQHLSGNEKPRGHIFDLGAHDNLHAVCGTDMLSWLLPGRAAAAGDGLSFPTRL